MTDVRRGSRANHEICRRLLRPVLQVVAVRIARLEGGRITGMSVLVSLGPRGDWLARHFQMQHLADPGMGIAHRLVQLHTEARLG